MIYLILLTAFLIRHSLATLSSGATPESRSRARDMIAQRRSLIVSPEEDVETPPTLMSYNPHSSTTKQRVLKPATSTAEDGMFTTEGQNKGASLSSAAPVSATINPYANRNNTLVPSSAPSLTLSYVPTPLLTSYPTIIGLTLVPVSPMPSIFHKKSIQISGGSSKLLTLSLRVFLPESNILDDEAVSNFENVAKGFILSHINDIMNLPKDITVDVDRVTITSQVFAWKRQPAFRSLAATGLDVYFEADALVTGLVTKERLEKDVQSTFDQYQDLFRSSLVLYGAPSLPSNLPREDDEPSSVSFDSISITLGVVAVCSGMMAVVIAALMYLRKSKHLVALESSVVEVRPKEKSILATGSTPYPIQKQRLERLDEEQMNWDDVSFVTVHLFSGNKILDSFLLPLLNSLIRYRVIAQVERLPTTWTCHMTTALSIVFYSAHR